MTNQDIALKDKLNRLFEMRVADETVFRPMVSAQDSHAIAAHLNQSLAQVPLEDMQDDYTVSSVSASQTRPEPKTSNTLPKTIETLPSEALLCDVEWQQLKNLPGYSMSPIRKLGRDIFGSFDCFKAHCQDQDAQGKDPLGEVLVISDFTHGNAVTSRLAKIIAENGYIIEKGTVQHPATGPNYEPDIMVLVAKDWTFKLVMERQENGAPVDLNSIYAWPGGADYYKSLDSKSALVPKRQLALK